MAPGGVRSDKIWRSPKLGGRQNRINVVTAFVVPVRDLCDACAAPASVLAVREESEQVLTLCAHHARMHGPALLAGGWVFEGALDSTSMARS